MHVSCRISKDTATIKIYNTYCFSVAIMVTETRLNIKLHIYEYIACVFSNYHSKVIKTDKFSINLISLPTAIDQRRSHLKSNSVLDCGAAEVAEGHF